MIFTGVLIVTIVVWFAFTVKYVLPGWRKDE